MSDGMKEIESVIKEFQKEMEAVAVKFREQAQGLFKSAFKSFWDENPNIEAVVWTQYTPYFNDGSPCEFGVNEMYMLTKKGLEEWKESGDNYWEADGYTPLRRHYGKLTGPENYIFEDYANEITVEEAEKAEEFLSILNQAIPDEVMLQLFGDHVQVVATRKGFDVEEHEHE